MFNTFSRITQSFGKSSGSAFNSLVTPGGTPVPAEPFVITVGTTGAAIEQVFALEHVLSKPTVLIHLECQGLALYLQFFPAGTSYKYNDEGKIAQILVDQPTLVLFDRSVPRVIAPLVGLGEGANYRQIVEQPIYQTMAIKLKVAAAAPASSFGSSARGGLSIPVVCTIVGLVFLSTVLFFSTATTAPQGGQPMTSNSGGTPQVAAVMTAQAPVATSLGDQLNEVEKQILTKVVAESGIELTAGGKPFVIFSDPNCPSCRQLEAQLATLGKGLSPVIVPVSFQRNSAEAVSSLLCSTDIPGAWRTAVAADRNVAASGGCAKGQAQADANNAAFTALKFDRTPTIVTSSGKVAVGIKDFDGLTKWIKSNS